jgi:hypothetical protein
MINRMVPIFLHDRFWNGGLSVFQNRFASCRVPFLYARSMRCALISQAVGHLDVSVDWWSDSQRLIVRGLSPPPR